MTQDKKKTAARPLPPEVIERVYEEWVAPPDQQKIVSLKRHKEMGERTGWWFSGKRGWGLTLEPLPPDLSERLDERDDHPR